MGAVKRRRGKRNGGMSLVFLERFDKLCRKSKQRITSFWKFDMKAYDEATAHRFHSIFD